VSKDKVDKIFGKKKNNKLQKLLIRANRALNQSETAQTPLFDLSKLVERKILPLNKPRSESFHSTSSVDSLDMAIIEDLSEIMKRPTVGQ